MKFTEISMILTENNNRYRARYRVIHVLPGYLYLGTGQGLKDKDFTVRSTALFSSINFSLVYFILNALIIISFPAFHDNPFLSPAHERMYYTMRMHCPSHFQLARRYGTVERR